MRRFILPTVLLLVTWSSTVPAAEVAGLYQAEVTVSGQQREERRVALRVALEQVLVKVTGRRDVMVDAALTEAAKNPARYIQQYRYRTARDGVPHGRSEMLWVQFDRGAINRLLREAELPIWGRARPSVVVWLAVERRGRRSLVGSDDAGVLRSTVEARAADRGLPLIVPLLDLEDQSRLRVSDVWGGFDDPVLAASRRYHGDAVLVARAFQVLRGLWEVRWSLLGEGLAERWSTQADVLGIALDEGIDKAADMLAARFASLQGEVAEGAVELLITEVNSLGDYARAVAYLKSLDLVTGVRATRLARGQAWFRLDTAVGRNAVARAIGLGRTLEPLETAEPWEFRLVP